MENEEFKLGEVFLLEVLQERNKHGKKVGRYRCFCGKEFTALTTVINTKKTLSCGCLRVNLLTGDKNPKYKHGACGTRLYETYRSMLSRCYNNKKEHYKDYGGRGITVCKEWLSDFEVFQKWALANGYEEHLTIDRENNDGNYEPGNCRFVTKSVQAMNRRTFKNNSSGYRGVYKYATRWESKIFYEKI